MPTVKQLIEWDKEYRAKKEEFEKQLEEKYKDVHGQKPKLQFDPSKMPKKRCDSPYTMEDDTATFIWIVVMAVATIFKGNWIIWIIATIVWRRFVTR